MIIKDLTPWFCYANTCLEMVCRDGCGNVTKKVTAWIPRNPTVNEMEEGCVCTNSIPQREPTIFDNPAYWNR
jgi:hypothetical protein